jgi:hypothetical protein
VDEDWTCPKCSRRQPLAPLKAGLAYCRCGGHQAIAVDSRPLLGDPGYLELLHRAVETGHATELERQRGSRLHRHLATAGGRR